MNEKQQQGVIKFYRADKGYGFIQPDDGSKDVFVHVTGVADGAKICERDAVRYHVAPSERGPKAVNVELVD